MEKKEQLRRERLLEPIKKDMWAKARKWNIPYMDDDDKFQEVYLKCWTALDQFTGNASPRTYLWRVMSNHLINMFRHAQINQPDYSTQIEEDDICLEKIVDIKILREQVIEDIKKLPEIERDVLKLRFGLADGITHTLREIGDILNLSKTRINQIEKEAISKIKSLKELKK